MGKKYKNDDPMILANFGIGLVNTGDKIINAAKNKTLFPSTTIMKFIKYKEQGGFELGD